ncbi:MAG: hypothetical protein ACYSSO_15485 [Planctomycetota bacterium]
MAGADYRFPSIIEEYRNFNYFQYKRPSDADDELYYYCKRVFSGEMRHPWIDQYVDTIFPRTRVIKDIRANLILLWIHTMFAEIPLLFIIRHPCAVVLSRIQLGWATHTDIEPFLSQPELVEDFLYDKLDLIRQVKSVEEKHAIIWCISNLVPLRQFHSNRLNVIFYENLCIQPEEEVPKIFQAIKREYEDSVFEHIHKPSTTASRTSAVVTGNHKVTQWKKELSPKQIGNIFSVVQAFGLDYVYGDSTKPLVET